jgi:serine/threonine protein phosphatase PrpC/LysM repeat protein
MVEVALVSHPGRVRTENEDYAYHGETPHGYVGIVCDGMGGEAAGEVAARIAAEAVFQYLLQAPAGDPAQLLKEAIQTAQDRLLQVAQQNPQYQKFGTTIAIALIKDHLLSYAHVGDSRIYLYSRHTLTLLTEDDSLVQQMLREGLITPEQALHHPQKNILSQCLGPHQNPTPHIRQMKLRPKDIVLVCTDGLSNLLSQDELVSQLTQHATLSAAAENLVAQANRQGGYDNITVLLLRAPSKTPTFALSMKLPPTKYLIAGGIGLVVIILLVVAFPRRSSPTPTDANDVIILTDSTETGEAPPTASEGNLPAPPETEPLPPSPNEATPAPAPPSETPQPPTETKTPTKTSTKTSTTSSSKPSSPATSKTTTIEITVQKGDNLTQIAKAFRTTRSSIQSANHLASENIRAGQKLSIPVKGIQIHTVQKGENLSKLAREYHSSIEAIRRANNLSDKDEIKAGQKLKIPILE